MGYAYAGEAGMIAGFSWATLCNWQMSMAWYRRPWYHAGGMIAGYMAFKVAAAYEDAQLKGKENLRCDVDVYMQASQASIGGILSHPCISLHAIGPNQASRCCRPY